MDISLTSKLNADDAKKRDALLRCAGLVDDGQSDVTVLVRDGEELAAVGSRHGSILKLIAVDEGRRGEDLTATVLTELRKNAFESGYRHLFLYTKPKNRYAFSSLFFYPVAESEDVLLLEDRRDGIREFISTLPEYKGKGRVAALVMNCNPFTRGHRYLAERAARECERVFIFVLSEDKSFFSASDRLEMVRAGVSDLENVTVLPTGPYLISQATFPTYFLHDRDTREAQCMLDIEIFVKYYVPRLSITHRYIGSEPFSPLTDSYNAALRENLPRHNVEVVEIPRLCEGDIAISASEVRKRIEIGDTKKLYELLPDTTLDYLSRSGII